MAAHFEITSAHLPTLTHTTPPPTHTHTQQWAIILYTLYKEPASIFAPPVKAYVLQDGTLYVSIVVIVTTLMKPVNQIW